MNTSADQLLELATQQHRAGDLAGARQLYDRVLAEQPALMVAVFRLGLLELQQGNLQRAKELIEQAQAACPDDEKYRAGLSEVNCSMAFAMQTRGDLAQAECLYRAALKLDANHVRSMSNFGSILQATGRIDAAIQMLEQAAKLDPDDVANWINLGAALCRQRRFSEARAVLADAVDRHGENVDAIYNLATALQGLGQLRQAVEQYLRAIALHPHMSRR